MIAGRRLLAAAPNPPTTTDADLERDRRLDECRDNAIERADAWDVTDGVWKPAQRAAIRAEQADRPTRAPHDPPQAA